jgi:hypothetical protein
VTYPADKVAARMARIEKRKGYADREARHFTQWEKQMARLRLSWYGEQFDQEHEALMRAAIEQEAA